MKLQVEMGHIPPAAPVSGKLVRIGDETLQPRKREQLLKEHLLEVWVNEHPVWRIVCTPTMLPELVLGRLLSEGAIRTAAQVELLELSRDGLRATVVLNQEIEPATEQPVLVDTCAAGNKRSKLFAEPAEPEQLRPIPYRPEWIAELARCFFRGTEIYLQTHCSHSAFLMRDGEILAVSEDIGRHNAVDKILGWALRQEVPLSECICYTSGRVPVDMIMKVIRAGIPVLVSKAQPTEQSLRLAKQYGLTLIGAAHEDSYILYHAPQTEAEQ